ncbi:MAG: hypothetical protein DRR19_08580 [Candidatus Parabeggiatoa sp. nov. 1]|nr:MAG: hypothetical protein DRR19_08580 [Gammaproteobacteria bacterium]
MCIFNNLKIQSLKNSEISRQNKRLGNASQGSGKHLRQLQIKNIPTKYCVKRKYQGLKPVFYDLRELDFIFQ